MIIREGYLRRNTFSTE